MICLPCFRGSYHQSLIYFEKQKSKHAGVDLIELILEIGGLVKSSRNSTYGRHFGQR